MIRRLRQKLAGALIAWTCVLLGHRYGPCRPDGWAPCQRTGCSFEQQWTGAAQ